MKTKKAICVLLVAAAVLFGACQAPEPEAEPVRTPEPTVKATPLSTQTPEPTLAVRSYTSGKLLDAPPEYKPVGVMIENNRAARPQSGMQFADIVYEAPVEGCTRFFCIFNDTLPESVGPVRSSRIYYIKIQQEWDCMYVHFGGPKTGEANVYDKDSEHIKQRVDFIKGKYNSYYWRDKNKKSPHNVFINIQKLRGLIEEQPNVRTFLFDEQAGSDGQGFSEVKLPFFTGEVIYRYDDARGVLVRETDGKPFTDALTDEQIAVQNLIVQYHHFYHGSEKKGRWLCDQLGTGKAEFFIAGKHISGTWEREKYDMPTIYKDSSGNEIVLRPGNTWIALHPDSKDIMVTY